MICQYPRKYFNNELKQHFHLCSAIAILIILFLFRQRYKALASYLYTMNTQLQLQPRVARPLPHKALLLAVKATYKPLMITSMHLSCKQLLLSCTAKRGSCHAKLTDIRHYLKLYYLGNKALTIVIQLIAICRDAAWLVQYNERQLVAGEGSVDQCSYVTYTQTIKPLR